MDGWAPPSLAVAQDSAPPLEIARLAAPVLLEGGLDDGEGPS